MCGHGAVASWAVMATVFVFGLCGNSEAVVASVQSHHHQRSHIAHGGCHTGQYQRPARASELVGQM